MIIILCKHAVAISISIQHWIFYYFDWRFKFKTLNIGELPNILNYKTNCSLLSCADCYRSYDN